MEDPDASMSMRTQAPDAGSTPPFFRSQVKKSDSEGRLWEISHQHGEEGHSVERVVSVDSEGGIVLVSSASSSKSSSGGGSLFRRSSAADILSVSEAPPHHSRSSSDSGFAEPLVSMVVQEDGPRPPGEGLSTATTAAEGEDKWLNTLLKKLEKHLPRPNEFPAFRHRWNTNEEIASLLTAFEKHPAWEQSEMVTRPASGSMLLYDRRHVKYRKDGYTWKTRKDGKTIREDHMKLKVRGVECIYGRYVHSAVLPSFHRRCYWLMQNANLVLVHYLNVPTSTDGKRVPRSPAQHPPLDVYVPLSGLELSRDWTYQELKQEIIPMLYHGQSTEGLPPFSRPFPASATATEETNQSDSTTGTSPALDINRRFTPEETSGIDVEALVLRILRRQGQLRHQKKEGSGEKEGAKDEAKTMAKDVDSSRKQQIPTTPVSVHCQGGPQQHHVLLRLLPTTTTSAASTGTRSILIFNSLAPPPSPALPRQPLGTAADALPLAPVISSTVSAAVASPVVNQNQTSFQQQRNPSVTSSTQTDLQESSPSAEAVDASVKPWPEAEVSLTSDPGETQQSMKDCGAQPMEPSSPCLAWENLECSLPESASLLSELDMLDLIRAEAGAEEGKDAHPAPPSCQGMDFREGTALITDFSPEWASVEGGTKLLITGPWYSSTSPYSVVFDGVSVPAALVQSGVLRCFTPAVNGPGKYRLQVACEGYVITNPIEFEFRSLPPPPDPVGTTVVSSEEEARQFHLLKKFQWLQKFLSPNRETQTPKSSCTSLSPRHSVFEDSLVVIARSLASSAWSSCWSAPLPPQPPPAPEGAGDGRDSLPLLHLVASLGYSRLLCALLDWREENRSSILDREVDALLQDKDGMTPLMHASRGGHQDVAMILYQWNRASLSVRDKEGRGALDWARLRGHHALCEFMERAVASGGKAEAQKKPQGVAGVMPSMDDFLSPEPRQKGVKSVSPVNSDVPGTEYAVYSSLVPSAASGEVLQARRLRLAKRSSVDSGINVSCGGGMPAVTTTHHVTATRPEDRHRPFHPASSFPPSSSAAPSLSLSFDSGSDLISSEIREESHASSPLSFMETEGVGFADFDGLSDDEPDAKLCALDPSSQFRRESFGSCDLSSIGTGIPDEQEERVLTIAEQIIAAMPERIKNERSREGGELMGDASPLSQGGWKNEANAKHHGNFLEVDFSDLGYRHPGMIGTPASSMSPASSTCLQSPCPSFTPLSGTSATEAQDAFGDIAPGSCCGDPTTADFSAFLQASSASFMSLSNSSGIPERDFSKLTLSDREQRELYDAARVIQKAYRLYKGRKRQEEERAAAIVIQNYYRRYKQFAFLRTRAAIVIQHQFRNYCQTKRRTADPTAFLSGRHSREGTPTSLKRTLSQRRKNQAARKIQEFMRQSKNKLQRERAGQ